MITNIPPEEDGLGDPLQSVCSTLAHLVDFSAWKQSGRADAALKRHSNWFQFECPMLASLLDLVQWIKGVFRGFSGSGSGSRPLETRGSFPDFRG
ncbi:hypothetical protein HNR46_004135 [Haloferula luteola]|uniref:Uncharacterized protein n=1 Tax=Haloferula luteola TaxID=595692 RepID=A0A840VML6_9BACT|nr:hypothetical protein [Haloferula luteola]